VLLVCCVCSGVAVHDGALLTKGAVWGEDTIVMAYAPNLVHGHNARAISFVECLIIDWDTLEAISGDTPSPTPKTVGHPRGHPR
jgi:hypothetical protein